MITVRPIVEAESRPFLALMCDVFDLDPERAAPLYYSEPGYSHSTRWGLFDGDHLVSGLSATPLTFGIGRAIGIAGVATEEAARREGCAGRLILTVLQAAGDAGFDGALLFSKRSGLYERIGFEELDQVVKGPIAGRDDPDAPTIALSEARARYDAWSAADPLRLRRDEHAWARWSSRLRVCSEFNDGYLCWEVDQVREAVCSRPPEVWPVPDGTEWFGLRSMANQLALPLSEASVELSLMACGFRAVPQMYMTDQF